MDDSQPNHPVANTSAGQPDRRKAGPGFHAPTELVTFVVGEEGREEPFKLHKEFVCFHSPVLRAAFNNPRFTEGETQTYCLDDVSPSCFRLFVQWMYTQKFDIVTPGTDLVTNHNLSPERRSEFVEQDFTLVQLWILGDKFLIHGLQDKVVDLFIHNAKVGIVFNTRWFQYAYDHTAENSALRRFAVDYTISSRAAYKKNPQTYPQEMLLDLLVRYEALTHKLAISFTPDKYHVVTPPDLAARHHA